MPKRVGPKQILVASFSQAQIPKKMGKISEEKGCDCERTTALNSPVES